MRESSKQIKIVVFVTAVIWSLIGWHGNNAARYVQETYRKAVLCDQLRCDDLAVAAAKIEEMKLPAARK